MVQTLVESYQEEQRSLWGWLIRLVALFVVGFFMALLASVVLSGLGSTAYAASGTSVATSPIAISGRGSNAVATSPIAISGRGSNAVATSPVAISGRRSVRYRYY